ncbi:DUF2567 domain-containing protein [Mycolicibacterium llatzerense]|uniref:DUF2567 domain-containing protein n=1 Tax=Mycolicibacterium llatzerense TaxID=280871 RepID=UPI0021B63469|nr:DUF2567 domain-containing protein [Mycolicibacterium llatzerense]MCT7371099.1 hypothetical protein [Mycolicibacterium llatzerense]
MTDGGDERPRDEQNFAPSAETLEPPKLSHRAAALRVVVGLTLAGALGGLLWAFLAPPVDAVVALTKKGQRIHGYFGDESDRVFMGGALAVGLLTVIAVVAATLVWQWRAHRGPVLAGALALGNVAAAGALAGVGAAVAHWRYGTPDLAGAPLSPEHRVGYLVEAPPVFFGHSPWVIATTLFFPAGIAALVYLFCTLATKRDDLGAWPPVEWAPVRLPVAAAPAATDAQPEVPAEPSC